MKKFGILVAVVIMVAALSAPSPAFAKTFRVSAKALQASTGNVMFTAKSSKPAKVRVTVWAGKKQLRTITAKRSGSTYKASWDLTNAQGSAVQAGVYSYTVAAAASKTKASARGKVRVTPTPAPVTVPVPISVPAPVAPGASRWVGFYAQGNMETVANLDAIESQAGTRAAVVSLFVSDSEGFPVNRAKSIAARGSIPMITLEFKSIATKGGLDAINNGSMDAYIASFADGAKAHGSTVWIRPFHEMNSNWYAWSGTVNGNSPAKLVAAWKRTRDIFIARGATNVKFVWCVNSESVPNTAANTIEAYWPGEAAVDLVAIDGYNFGTSASWATWRTFGTTISDSYKRVTALSVKPLFLAETGCVEQGGSKAAWIGDMFTSIQTTYPRISGVCWFNASDPGQDFRIESSSASASAFKTAIANGY